MTAPVVQNIIAGLGLFVALLTLLVTAALTVVVYYATKRIAEMEYARSVRDAWMVADSLALQDDVMLGIADKLFHPDKQPRSTEKQRKIWFAYTVLNLHSSTFFGIKHGLFNSVTEGHLADMMRALLQDDDFFDITQHGGHEPEFIDFCRRVRAEGKKPPAEEVTA
jgi:hypothetical protein